MKKKTNHNAEVAITEQEFKTVKAVMEKVGAEGLYHSHEIIESLYLRSFKGFFAAQPLALSKIGASQGGGDFIEELCDVNEFLIEVTESCAVLQDVAMFLRSIFAAYERYEKPD